MTVKNKVEVRIAGKEYTLVGVESDEYIQKIGLYIDRKMNEVMRANSRLSTSMAAVLTSINVADDFFKSHENELQLKKEIKRCQDELERLREETRRLSEENASMNKINTAMQVELVKREAEITGVRSSLDMLTKAGN